MTQGSDSVSPLIFRDLAMRLAAGAFFYSGGLRLLQMRMRPGWGKTHRHTEKGNFAFLVLLYHRITPRVDPFFPSQSVRAFDGHMRYLAKRFHVLSITEILGRIREGKEFEPWTVAITFDDGYRDNYLYAHPILRKYGLSASVFVPTGYIETGRILWNDRVAWAVKVTQKDKIILPSLMKEKRFPLQTLQQRRIALGMILEELKTYPEEQKTLLVDELLKNLQNGSKGPEPSMLRWSELRELVRQGWEVGSHTVNHAILTRIPEAEVKQELAFSKDILEKELHIPVHIFAYPNGKLADITPRIKILVQEAGYQGAVTTLRGLNTTSLDPFQIYRQSPWEEHVPSFAIKSVQCFRDYEGDLLA